FGMLFHDGTHALVCGNEADHGTRCYMQDIAGGQPHPITPEGTNWGIVSPDDKSVLASGRDNKYLIYPIDGGAPKPVPWIAADESVIRWTVDGRGVLVHRQFQIPSLVELVDLSTGHRTRVRELSPADRAGVVQIGQVAFSDDGKSYAYSYNQNVSRLAVIEGVK
ncbi:MAG TPA: hypothetical protein VLV89_07570, partial [Candidatus Acidoferrum sp.]|nr:hypothetical protein [Candidatus Acidoferrum sp.]